MKQNKFCLLCLLETQVKRRDGVFSKTVDMDFSLKLNSEARNLRLTPLSYRIEINHDGKESKMHKCLKW